MSISEKINSDYLSAYKSHEIDKISVLRLLKSALKNAEISNHSALDDPTIIKIIQREIKQRRDSAVDYEKGGRDDLKQKELYEITILEKYLPKQLSDNELESIIKEEVKKSNATSTADLGQVMSRVMPRVAGQADGSRVSSMLRQLL